MAFSILPMRRDEIPDRRHKLDRHFHQGVRAPLDGRFILGRRLLISLVFVVFEHPLHPVLVPTRW